MAIISDIVLVIILMNPYLPYILPRTKQMPDERVERERGKEKTLLWVCVFSIIYVHGITTRGF